MERFWELRRPPPLFDSYNVAPSQQVPVIRQLNSEGREAILMRWGLIPPWAKGLPQKYSTHIATVERMKSAPFYRNAWRRAQRCLIPANAFYEWQSVPGQNQKQPYYIQITDPDYLVGGGQFGFAGLWESSRRDDGEVIESFTIITMPANAFMAEIHNSKKRMPLIVPKEAYQAWLAGSEEQADHCLVPYPDNILEAYPVSTYVNNPGHNEPKCIEPLAV